MNAALKFFLLTFAFTWTTWLAPRAFGAPGNGTFFGLGGPVFYLGVFAPAIVALALTAQSEGGAGVGRLLARIGKWQVAARFYLFAILYMAATKLIAAVIHRVVTGAWPAFGDTPLLLMLGAILVSTWVQAGEELGWRGYALPRLATHLGLGGASVVLGVIWALWHLPLFFLPGSGSDGQSFPIYLLHVTALSVAMAWLYWKTEGSLLLVMLMHASVNNTSGIVPAAVANPVDPVSFNGSLVAWASVAVAWVVAAPLLWRMRGARIGALLLAIAVGASAGLFAPSSLAAQERSSFPTQDGGVVSAVLYGGGSHGVVLAHGGRYNKESWDTQARTLADAGFRVLAFDFRGHGESRGPTPGNNDGRRFDVQAAVTYLRQAGATSVSVVGASMGGDYAAEAAEAQPELMDRLVLIAAGAYTTLSRMRGRTLFIMSRDDIIGENTPRLPAIRERYERASGPREFLILDGSAHAQDIFASPQGDRLMQEILRFLSAP